MTELRPGSSSFDVLRRFVRRPTRGERCELCNQELGHIHQHLLEPASRKLACACEACSILFSGQGQKYKRVPRRVRALAGFQMSDADWDGLMLPINMAFFFRSTPLERMVALYPSPAGATESLLALETWSDIELTNPVLYELEADVEALLVNRIGHARGFAGPEYYLVPIDECFKLVGLIRSRWQGLSGGAEVWKEVGQFFGELKLRSPEFAGRSNA